jgi:hypothetical protein
MKCGDCEGSQGSSARGSEKAENSITTNLKKLS